MSSVLHTPREATTAPEEARRGNNGTLISSPSETHFDPILQTKRLGLRKFKKLTKVQRQIPGTLQHVCFPYTILPLGYGAGTKRETKPDSARREVVGTRFGKITAFLKEHLSAAEPDLL